MAIEHLWLFITAGFLLNLTPGPDVLFIVSHALRSGARVGIVAGLGITAGCLFHVTAAALGLSALMAASGLAFSVLKWAGAAYLVWMGVRMLLASRSAYGASFPAAAVKGAGLSAASVSAPAQLGHIFFKGFWTNVLNPKVALFFLAFVPQFISPEASHKALAFAGLGLLFTVNSTFVNAGWAWLAAGLAKRSSVVQQSLYCLDKLAGFMFLTFGFKLALMDTPAS
jgi:threonine/homoserine/homoserine lactone efflux protein